MILIKKLEKLSGEYPNLYESYGDNADLNCSGAVNEAINIVKEHSDWISLDERLPEDNCYVLVYCCGGNIGKSFFTYNRKYLAKRDTFYSRKTYGKNSGYFAISHDEGYKVTHWQPLLNPPSEVQDES